MESQGPTPTEPSGFGGASFVLFVAGVPREYADPSSGYVMFSTHSMGGAPLGAVTIGGPEAADLAPGQIYGEGGRVGRMVVDLARRHRIAVKVVDVDAPGVDQRLLERYVGEDPDLPILLRADGARIEGDEAFVPEVVERFLLQR